MGQCKMFYKQIIPNKKKTQYLIIWIDNLQSDVIGII